MIIDLHNHTSRYSDCSRIAPDDLIQLNIRLGLEGLCITEHNMVWPVDERETISEKYAGQIKLFFGMEVDTSIGHVLVFGSKLERVEGPIPFETLLKIVDPGSSALVWAHPFRWKPIDPEPHIDPSIIEVFDGIEAFNGNCPERVNSFTENYFKRHAKKLTGGSDTHGERMAGKFATRFTGPVATIDELVTALKKGAFEPVML